jgi:secreted trypsin-like serine protease
MMRSLVSLVLLSAVASSLGGDAYSSQRRELAARIIGGSDVAPNTYPFFAFVFVETEDGSVPCGGSLIHTDIILTAASCILSETIEVAVNLTSFDASEGSYSRSIAQVLVHPEFNIELLENDIALLKLEGGIPEITPAVYNRMTGTPVEGNSVTVVGFGSLTEEDNNFPRVLQQVEVEVHNFDTCNIAYEGMLDPNRQLCGGVQEGGKVRIV